MSEKEMRKYLVFCKKSKVNAKEAIKRMITVHKISSKEDIDKAMTIMKAVYGD